MKKSIIIFIACMLVFSCNSDDTEMDTVQATKIAQDNLYGNGAEGLAKQNMVLRTSESWNALMAQMDAVNNTSGSFSETDIDFSKYMIIACFDDIKGNGGHVLELDITSNSKRIQIVVTDVVPNGDATLVITQPFHIVKIPISDLPIVFK